MKRIKVGGVAYTIKFANDPRTVDPDKENAAQSLAGCVNYQRRVIGLHSNSTKVEIEQTFFHELAHLITKTYHITSLVTEDGTHNEAAMDYFGIGLQEAFASLGVDVLTVLKRAVK